MKKLFKWKITITLETGTEIETQVVADSVKSSKRNAIYSRTSKRINN